MKRYTSWSLPVVALVAAAVAGSPQQAAAQEMPAGVTQAMIDQGKTLFAGAGMCSACHGELGVGSALAPALNDAKWLHIDGSFTAINDLVTKGVPAPKEAMIPMAPKGGSAMTDVQVKAVAAYVWSLTKTK